MDNNYRSPEIRKVPEGKERLIDTGMLHFESSVAGYNERYHRGETSHTIHVWWARRPHSAMRSLVFSSLCKDKGDEATRTMAEMAMNCDSKSVEKARAQIKEGYDGAPKVLDMFGGGGTIPFEAKRLGTDVYSIDSNELSVFIQKCNMLYSDNIDLKKAVQKIEIVGNEVLSNLKRRTEWLYPLRSEYNEELFGYVWTYRIECPHCKKKIMISKRPWLSKKKGRRIGFIGEWDDNESAEKFVIKNVAEDEHVFTPHWQRYAGTLFCPSCNKLIDEVNVLECEDTMTAYIKTRTGGGKDFLLANQNKAIPDKEKIEKAEKELLNKMHISLPDSELPKWSGIVNPALYTSLSLSHSCKEE